MSMVAAGGFRVLLLGVHRHVVEMVVSIHRGTKKDTNI